MRPEEYRLFIRLAPLALLVGIVLGLVTANVWWLPGVGYVIIP